ncbi:MAG TPA: histidine phosphatase family protein [Candidatus Deferrimicrobiaceae bacterium]
MTDLWLVRHGEAAPASMDPSRPLSAEGVRAIAAIASTLAGEMGRPDFVAASEKLRARQTAEIFCAATGYPVDRIGNTTALSPDATPESFLAFLEEQAADGCVLCVGHLPSIAVIASVLLAERDPVKLVFGPGSVCRIRLVSVHPGKGELLFFR